MLSPILFLFKSMNGKWWIEDNESKWQNTIFATRDHTCPLVTLNNLLIPQTLEVKYLCI